MGDTVVEGGRRRANVWQGRFPGGNTGEDVQLLTSPVGACGANALGPVDMEWTADWFRGAAFTGESTPAALRVRRL